MKKIDPFEQWVILFSEWVIVTLPLCVGMSWWYLKPQFVSDADDRAFLVVLGSYFQRRSTLG